MKTIKKLSLIYSAAIMFALPLAGCSSMDSGNAAKPDVEQKIETLMDENEDCPDGKCPENKDENCDKLPEDRDGNGDKCPDGECPDGKCPAKRLPHGRHGRVKPLPCPHKGN